MRSGAMSLPLLLLPLAAWAIHLPSESGSGDITLVTFGKGDTTERQWKELNDPVMGGKSTGTWTVKNGVGVFDGEVVDVPSLKAPGFIKTSTVDTASFQDISSCKSMFFEARASTEYSGYRLSFGTKKSFGCSFFSGGFKSHFNAPVGSAFQRVEIPFSNFSDCNSDATGEPSKTCASDPSVCPDTKTLQDVKTISFWGEGAKGTVHLEIKSIGASGCSSSSSSSNNNNNNNDPSYSSPSSCTVYNRIEEDTCAEDCLGSTVGICPVGLVVSKGNLKKGSCASLGYTVAAGEISQKAGPCGTLKFKTYTKPPTGDAASDEAAGEIVLATFDGADESTTREWKELNDPVMGGRSTGNFTVSGNLGRFRGEVVDVPSLQAPGFIKAQTQDAKAFPDISSCKAIVLSARAGVPYDGYRFQFGNKRGAFCSFFSSGFKTHFAAPVSDEIQRIVIPLGNFSDCNSDSTGEPSKLCSDDPRVCPDPKTLRNVKTIAVWGEGKAGTVDLDIKSIAATGCSSTQQQQQQQKPDSPRASQEGFNGKNTCSGSGIQAKLRYNMTGRVDEMGELPFPLAEGETLPTGICCDSAYAPYAEPRFLFNRSDVALFPTLQGQERPVTFYDSVCGIPLFRAPLNRSFEEFRAETAEHGWPSFRPAEVVAGNVKILENGYVVSKCGTHLGSNLPDEKGTRYCLDLSCISGNPQ